MGIRRDCQSQGFLSQGLESQSPESRDCHNDFCPSPKSPRELCPLGRLSDSQNSRDSCPEGSPGILEFLETKMLLRTWHQPSGKNQDLFLGQSSEMDQLVQTLEPLRSVKEIRKKIWELWRSEDMRVLRIDSVSAMEVQFRGFPLTAEPLCPTVKLRKWVHFEESCSM